MSDASNDVPEGYQLKTRSVIVGRGDLAFHKAASLLHQLMPLKSLCWVDCSLKDRDIQSGDTFATITRFYNTPLWSLNPCRCVSSVRDNQTFCKKTQSAFSEGREYLSAEWSSRRRREGVRRFSEVVFSTLQGHLIAGEEALRVFTVPVPADGCSTYAADANFYQLQQQQGRGRQVLGAANDGSGAPVDHLPLGGRSLAASILAKLRRALSSSFRDSGGSGSKGEHGDAVVFEVVSYSRGSGVLGRLCMPLIRPLQDKFMRDCCGAMLRLMKAQ